MSNTPRYLHFTADRVWIVHADGYSAGTLMRPLSTSTTGSEDLKVKVTATGEILTVDDGDIEKVSSQSISEKVSMALFTMGTWFLNIELMCLK